MAIIVFCIIRVPGYVAFCRQNDKRNDNDVLLKSIFGLTVYMFKLGMELDLKVSLTCPYLTLAVSSIIFLKLSIEGCPKFSRMFFTLLEEDI